MSKLATSKSDGIHKRFRDFVGMWSGSNRTWFKPSDTPDDESSVSGEMRLVVDEQYLEFEYAGKLSEHDMIGKLIVGADLHNHKLHYAWIDCAHTSTAVQSFEGDLPDQDQPLSASGTYGHDPEQPRWGWRITLELIAPDHLLIKHYNITPAGQEALGVEWDLRRNT